MCVATPFSKLCCQRSVEEPLLGRPLREEEARYFAQIVRRITAILLLSPALDASYAAILPEATGIVSSIQGNSSTMCFPSMLSTGLDGRLDEEPITFVQ
jgi:hypothetical protein